MDTNQTNNISMPQEVTDTVNKVKKGFSGLTILAIIIAVLFIWVVTTRNGLALKSKDVDAKFSAVDTQLQRRYDLIPNLVETVKGVAKQEQEVFGKLAEARSQYAGATTPSARLVASGQVESALARLLVITENYPELRSSESFQNLMTQLEGTENRVTTARLDYTNEVTAYNKMVVRFPANIIAKLFGYGEKPVFSATEQTRQNPKVQF